MDDGEPADGEADRGLSTRAVGRESSAAPPIPGGGSSPWIGDRWVHICDQPPEMEPWQPAVLSAIAGPSHHEENPREQARSSTTSMGWGRVKL